MSESRHSKGDAANVESTAPAHGHVDEFRNVPPDEQFVGALDGGLDLDPEDVFRNARPIDELRLRRERRARMETLRSRVLVAGAVLFAVLLALGHSASGFALLLLLIIAAMQIRRLGE